METIMTEDIAYLKAYIVFKHVYTESDTGVREYEMESVFANYEDAKRYVTNYYRVNKYNVNFHINGTLDIDVVVLCRNEVTKTPWKWIPRFDTYIWSKETGLFKWFKSITSAKIIKELQANYTERHLEYVHVDNLGSLSVSTPMP